MEEKPRIRGNTTDYVYKRLLKDFQHGLFMPGDKMSTEQLAQHYEVSRTPIREALVRLERDGLLTVSTNTGYEVRHLSLQELCDMYEIREVLEGMAVEKLTLRGASPELIAKMRHYCEQRRKPGDFDTQEAGERAFHLLICESCGSEILSKLVQNCLILSIVFNLTRFWLHDRASGAVYVAKADIHVEHDEIINAIEKGDAKQAKKLLCLHISQARKRIEKWARRIQQL